MNLQVTRWQTDRHPSSCPASSPLSLPDPRHKLLILGVKSSGRSRSQSPMYDIRSLSSNLAFVPRRSAAPPLTLNASKVEMK